MSDELFLDEPFRALWSGQDPFAAAEALEGEVLRALEGRRTLRTEVEGRGYYAKIHRGVGWKEIVKNLLSGRLAVLGAGNEWRAIRRLETLGVETMKAVAFGERGLNPATRHSFIVTEELAPTVSLEDFCRHWRERPPEPALKQALVRRVADMARRMHEGGVNHRDFYICHFLLHLDPPPSAGRLKLSLIDLHRAQVRERPAPRRWAEKDLAALHFSSLDIGLTRCDRLRFLRTYFDRPLREILRDEAPLLDRLERESTRLQERYWRKFAPRAGNAFGSLDAIFTLEGELVARDPMTRVLRVTVDSQRYYVKRYQGLGKKPLRRLFAQPRLESEWKNLRHFEAWGIPTAKVVAYGSERRFGKFGRFIRGALVTEEIPNTTDLITLATKHDPRLGDRRWVASVSRQLARIARRMHGQGFVHNDFKWRNLLVTGGPEPRLYLIDCPSGGFWWGPFLRYRIVKDLACLDKVAKHHLSRTQRLRFYLDYTGKHRLDAAEKRRIRKIVGFFEGRE